MRHPALCAVIWLAHFCIWYLRLKVRCAATVAPLNLDANREVGLAATRTHNTILAEQHAQK
jgi:hypothetical protein